MHVFLGLGTNLGDREMNLIRARDELMKRGVLVMGQSEVRETEPLIHPVYGGEGQPMYLNQVIECQTELEPMELLMVCKQVEAEMGRPVQAPSFGNVSFGLKPKEASDHWQSRIIDIDIHYYGDQIHALPQLSIPHPGAAERRFNLECMADVWPDFVHPVHKKSIRDLLADAK